MGKITYLFGAGASREALPIVDEIPKRVEKLILLLKNETSKIDPKSELEGVDKEIVSIKLKPFLAHFLELIESLEWMMHESRNHASIDTFAKKLFIREEDDKLKKLKIAMAIFFTFEQALMKPDPRYDAFYASLLTGLNRFPQNLNIVSWNYDNQFELAYAEYSGKIEIRDNQELLGIRTRNSRKNMIANDLDNVDEFRIFKLNGTAGYSSGRRDFHYGTNLRANVDTKFIMEVVTNFVISTYYNGLSPLMSFAWERDGKEIVQKVAKATINTSTLVIIGYSFPTFNREVDREIIGNMKQLNRVYIQSPDITVIERFQAIKGDIKDVISKIGVGQFLIPNEF